LFDAGPRAEDLARCVHCGFCLQACPTYVITSLETESPRGRIALARAVSERRIEPTPSVISHFDLCLQCRACETACPSGVPYGRIMEDTRALIHSLPDRPREWKLRSTVLRQLFARPWRLRLAFAGLRLYQQSGLSRIMRRLLPPRLRRMEEMMPVLPDHSFRSDLLAAKPKGHVKATVALLQGCVMPLIQPETHAATVRVLARNGCRVLVPRGQGCCGALHLHNGDKDAARELARRNIDLFLRSGAEYIAVNAAGCGSAMKEYGELFANDRSYADKAKRFVERVRDVNELLVELGFEAPTGSIDAKVTYQDSCHLVHAQRVRSAPRELLNSIPSLELVEMNMPDRCCGSAGIYNLTQTEMSRLLLDDKMDDCLATGCDIISTANPGCVLQLQLGVRLRESPQEVVHVVELLDRAYAAGKAGD
ncbi:MAG TPA: heterodisulfide reductase-related iron-sulfur binding cluster, partial [Dehalococcoidia bacterium]|nr:heterodisulfide reductase-related iron-sulfur binding cluster [Dehalococcoidia bacterium]